MTTSSIIIAFIVGIGALAYYQYEQKKRHRKNGKISLSDDIQKRYFDAYDAEMEQMKKKRKF